MVDVLGNVYIKNSQLLAEKLLKFKVDGPSKLHIISDFDKTLTKAYDGNNKVGTAYEKIRRAGILSDEYSRKASELFQKYYPLEISTSIPLDEKKLMMEEWWEKHYDLYIEFKLKFADVLTLAEKETYEMRDGFIEMFEQINSVSIPVLVFSAGIGNFIELTLQKSGVLKSNVKLVSNMILFDENGFACGYTKPLIHTFNKNEYEVMKKSYHSDIENRSNVILLGDNIGDTEMASGISHNCILKIGFLNKDTEKDLAIYAEQFDVLVLRDGDLSYVTEILSQIIRK